MRRMLEGTVATLAGGLILWWVTIPSSQAVVSSQPAQLSQPTPPAGSIPPSSEWPEEKVALNISAANAPNGTPIPIAETRETPARPASASLVPANRKTAPAITLSTPAKTAVPYSIPVGAMLLNESFSQCRDGDATEWGQNVTVTDLDRRKWLVPAIEGTYPVGRKIRLPQEFYFECRYSANVPEITRGLFGWWKEPLSTKITFLNAQGVKYTIEWVIGCGNDITRLQPLGSSSLYAKKYYHTIKLPDGAATEIGVSQPTGLLRIDRDNKVIKVFIDGQAAAVGTMSQTGQLVGFEIELVKAKNGTLFFTDFKIAR
jgi:hypothetical protein